MSRRLLPLALLALAACSTAPRKPAAPVSSGAPQPRPSAIAATPACTKVYAPAQEDLSKRGDYKAGGLYAPHVPDTTPAYVPNVDCIPEPLVETLPRSPVGNRSPYVVLGRNYHVLDRIDDYVEQGTASYYGSKFHGRRTSNLEVYDMYAFTAAHKSLPLPSFARVTNLDNGHSVVVRVNDRGPFHEGRVIDLSYAAAVKLGITARGTGRVEVRALVPGSAGSQLAAAPPRTTIATGVPTRIASGRPTALDQLVETLPASSSPISIPAPSVAQAPAPPAAAGSSQPWRYHAGAAAGSASSTGAASADPFDAWMQSRGVRVATGKPATAPAPAAAGAGNATSPPASSPAAAPQSAPQATAAAPAMSMASAPAVQLQVASFASRENADRAVARLSAAGIDRASLSDVASGGRTLWRVRVGAADAASASQLASRIAGLGFGLPQVVRD